MEKQAQPEVETPGYFLIRRLVKHWHHWMDPFCDVRSAGPVSYVFTFEHAADAAAARERCLSEW